MLLVSAGCCWRRCSGRRSSAISKRACAPCSTASRQCRGGRGRLTGHRERACRHALHPAAVGLVLAGDAARRESDLTDLASASLLEQRLKPTAEILPSARRGDRPFLSRPTSQWRTAAAARHRAALQAVRRRKDFSFLVAGNFDELRPEVDAFRRTLFAILAVLGAGLLLAILVQVHFGLRPLRAMQERLTADPRGQGRAARRPVPERNPAGRRRAQSAHPVQQRSRRARPHPGRQSRACAEDAAQSCWPMRRALIRDRWPTR